MKMILVYVVILLLSCLRSDVDVPEYLLGNFTDDYGINYTISDSIWRQHPDLELVIIEMDPIEMFILGNDLGDSTYTRIDYMPFQNQGDYTWGFCYTVYEKRSQSDALVSDSANRKMPKTGCNGFPFSRMKSAD